jgi:sugar phosphate isomerase/epimerase
MKITIREGMVPGTSLPEQLAWLESMGIDGIELHGASLELPREELRAVMHGSPIQASAIEGIPRLLDADVNIRDDAFRRTRERISLAAELDALGVLIVPQFGRVPALPDLSPWKTGADLERELLLSQLGELAPGARHAGVVLFTEPLNRYEAYMVNRVEQGAEIARAAGEPVATMADFFHMNIEEADIARSIRESALHIAYVHVADSNRAQPGKGHTDFRPGFAALKATGYDGWLGLECSRIIGDDYDTAIRETVDFLRRKWDAA